MFREAFLNKLSLLLRGTVAAPADRFGETLADEHMMGGEASPQSSKCLPSISRALMQADSPGWLISANALGARQCRISRFRSASTGAFTAGEGKPLVSPNELPNCNMRLYGGAQFHRAMAEFRVGVGAMACPTVTREEIVNACGMGKLLSLTTA